MNQIQADSKLQGRILFEHVPSGRKWLNVIAEAMRHGKVIQMTYQAFGRPEAYSFEAEPYYLKVANRRWYLLARSPSSVQMCIRDSNKGLSEPSEDIERKSL